MKLHKNFEVEGRTYTALTMKGAREKYREEVAAGLRHLDEGGTPKYLPLPDGRLMCVHMAFGTWGYSFVSPDGSVSGGCSFPPTTPKWEAMKRAQEHAAQYSAAA